MLIMLVALAVWFVVSIPVSWMVGALLAHGPYGSRFAGTADAKRVSQEIRRAA